MGTAYSPQGTARREADLVRMRAKWSRERKTVRRKKGATGHKTELLLLSDLARAIRVAKTMCRNEALIAHLELAATYFDEAEG